MYHLRAEASDPSLCPVTMPLCGLQNANAIFLVPGACGDQRRAGDVMAGWNE